MRKMLKKVMAALLAATAAVFPLATSAQDGGAERREMQRDGGDDNSGIARRAEARAARAEQRAERQADRQAERPARAERQVDQPRPSFRPERQADQPRPAAEQRARGGWQGRGDWGQRRAETPVAQQAQPQRDWTQRDGRRDRGQALAGAPRADWRRDDRTRTAPVVQQRRVDDLRRAQQNRRWDGNDGRRWDNDRRGDTRRWDNNTRNDSRWNNNGRQNWAWNDNRSNGGRTDWNRRWRDDNRYDWGRYRQQNRSLYRLPRYYAPYDWSYGYRRFSIGVSLSQPLWAEDYWISDPWYYRLPPADGPYRWVRYYNDALLVDLRSGEVVDTVYDIFY